MHSHDPRRNMPNKPSDIGAVRRKPLLLLLFGVIKNLYSLIHISEVRMVVMPVPALFPRVRFGPMMWERIGMWTALLAWDPGPRPGSGGETATVGSALQKGLSPWWKGVMACLWSLSG